MNAQLHSGWMALGRQIALCLSLLTLSVVAFGCGSSGETTSADINAETASEYTAKLAKIKDDAQAGDCEGALNALDALNGAVDTQADDNGAQFTADLQRLLGDLSDQIDSQCKQEADTTSTSSSSSSSTTDPMPVEPTTTTPTETEESTTKTETKTTTSTSTTQSTTPPPESGGNGGSGPGNPAAPGQNGANPGDGGGVSPGRSGKVKREKPGKGPKKPKRGAK